MKMKIVKYWIWKVTKIKLFCCKFVIYWFLYILDKYLK